MVGVLGVLALPCNGLAQCWDRGGSLLPAGTPRAGMGSITRGQAWTARGLAWATASPKCFAGTSPQAGRAALQSNRLLTDGHSVFSKWFTEKKEPR